MKILIMKWIVDKRIWVDFETKEILDTLSDIHINRDNLLCRIIHKWACDEVKKCERGYGFKNGIVYTGYRVSRIYLNIDNYIWDNFIDICSKRELDVSSGFKTAIFNFLNDE